jgi:RelB Antitoxin alpha helical domain
MTIAPKTQMKAEDYPFVKELIIDNKGTIQKVVINFSDYQRLLEAMEDEGLVLAMMEVKDETPLNLDEALAELEKE